MHPHVRTLILLPIFALTRALHAQAPPQILHTHLTTASAASGLDKQFETAKHSSQPAWLGYSIPLVPGMRFDTSTMGTLDLNNENSSSTQTTPNQHDSPNQGVLLFHIEQGSLTRIRLVDPARILDAGDQSFTWLTNVSPTESIRLLTTFAHSESGSREHRISHAALFAIAAHNTPEATTALASLAASSNPLDLREQASFWLAAQRGHEGFLAIQSAARNDPDDAYRKKLTFDLTLCKEPAALDELIRMAHSDASPEVRKQAQFWMANKGGAKVAGDLHGIATNDPDSEVRKSAVFALSRLPGDESTTRLIDLVKTSKDPVVRKQAVFWLGQSKDPHALDYLTSLIRQ